MKHFREVLQPTFGFKGEAGEAFFHIQNAWVTNSSAPFRHYLGFLNGQPVGAATAFYDHNDIIGIYNIATLDSYRRIGIGAALTAHAIREGQAAGGRIAVLQASRVGLNVYKLLGFEIGVDIGIYSDS
ncbi:acetyltransferase (GNAT) family protein [Paenibacillus taihuensis]|uniref:Acetyltransferase (GNAT) family protein n=2 Tax=Paenibacillus taihuensis TaxID=1156355 RepID=A0A3D9R2R4_9BACL|nr:acetyltransferase (GNAT) family protein [Paenibacillus taihuensis]